MTTDDPNSRPTEQRSTETDSGTDRTEPTPVRTGLRHGLLAVVATAFLLTVAAGAVAAHDNVPAEPGASGHCESGDDGGSFAVHGPGDHVNDFADAEEAQSAGQTAVHFAETRGECGGSGDAYLEVHVISAQNNAQYCYSGESDGDDGDTGHGDEPTDDATAGAGAGEVTVADGSRNYPPGHGENDNDACAYDANDTRSGG